VAFPDFMSVEVSSSGFGALSQLSGLPVTLGFSNDAFDSATISIPSADSYGLPVAPAMTALSEQSATLTELCKLANGSEANLFGLNKGAMYLVHEVYYTRAIDINIRASRANAFTASTDTSANTVVSKAESLEQGQAVTVSIAPGAGDSATQIAAAAAQGVTTVFAERQGIPGVSLVTRRASDRSVSMRRLFDRPVAIGIRAITFNLKKLGDQCVVSDWGPVASNGAPTTPATTLVVPAPTK
jgi:hypothetical protein